MKRSRNGRRGEREHVHSTLERLDAFFVRDPKALLFVNDEQAKVLEVYILRENAVRADDNVNLALAQRQNGLVRLLASLKAGEPTHDDPVVLEARFEGAQMLLREHSGGAK